MRDWYFSQSGKSQQILAEVLNEIGAIIMGNKAFGDAPDGFDTPYKVPHFILTHQARETVSRDSAKFIFVTDGIHSVLEQ